MPKKKQRKPRGKIRQQIRQVIDDNTFWDDDLLMADDIDYKSEIKDKVEQTRPIRKKRKLHQPTHKDIDLWVDDPS